MRDRWPDFANRATRFVQIGHDTTLVVRLDIAARMSLIGTSDKLARPGNPDAAQPKER